MEELKIELSQLIAQRNLLRFNFCSYKQNNIDNTQRLLTLIRFIEQANDNCLASAKSAAQILAHLSEDTSENKVQTALILSLKLIISPELQQQILPLLLTNQQSWLQVLALDVARMLGDNLRYSFDLSTVDFSTHNVASATDISLLDTRLLPQLFLYLHQRKTLNAYLSVVLPDYKNKQDRALEKTTLSVLSWLYIDVLSDYQASVEIMAEQFIAQDQLLSTLFDIYVTSLNETQVTQFINLLSADELLTGSVIYAMALSGYVKFIPFIAQYLQQPLFALQAHNALRLMLGDKLDAIIPLSVQFNSDADEQATDLTYYGAKILNAWQQQLPLLGLSHTDAPNENDPEKVNENQPEQKSQQQEHNSNVNNINRVLNGAALIKAEVDAVLTLGSQWHRYVATLYKQHFTREAYTPHAHALEVC